MSAKKARPPCLTEFLLARIAEDTDRAFVGDIWAPMNVQLRNECEAKRRIVEGHSNWHVCPNLTNDGYTDYGDGSGDEWEPICPTLRALASVYADHPDCRDEWAL